MTKQKENQKKEEFENKNETLYTKQQIVNSKKYGKYKDLLMSILQENKNYSNKQIDIKIKEFLERKV